MNDLDGDVEIEASCSQHSTPHLPLKCGGLPSQTPEAQSLRGRHGDQGP